MDELDLVAVEQSDPAVDSFSESDPDTSSDDLAAYTEDNPLPVVIVEEEESGVAAYSVTSAYYGTISDTYLDYFEGIVEKLKYNEHYVIWRSGQYEYTLCYGEDLVYEADAFTGSGQFVQIYRDSSDYSAYMYVRSFTDSLDLSAVGIFLYSDLGMFPTVKRGFSSIESTALLFAVGFSFVFSIVNLIFNNVKR